MRGGAVGDVMMTSALAIIAERMRSALTARRNMVRSREVAKTANTTCGGKSTDSTKYYIFTADHDK